MHGFQVGAGAEGFGVGECVFVAGAVEPFSALVGVVEPSVEAGHEPCAGTGLDFFGADEGVLRFVDECIARVALRKIELEELRLGVLQPLLYLFFVAITHSANVPIVIG